MKGREWGLEYPQWQQPVFAAILEMDRDKVDERIQKAMAAVFERLLTLVKDPNPTESIALAEVVMVLRVLQLRALNARNTG
jgi:hypothetical protein